MKNRIAILRKERGLTLTALAAAAGTTKAQIQKLERGERRLSLEWMEKLARAMNVKISDLLPGNEITCQHTAAETEILQIVQRLPEDDRFLLVRIAKELLGAPRSAETAEAPRPARRAAGRKA
ncbi:MAG: Transcriptional repressor [Alphaproteobacteria bacterium]|nr:Transcriptional repressor [Alphaproteobacteria bacterium]MDB5740845.1 Transcriptional repressor [Alphaproteobacteria bacterium]